MKKITIISISLAALSFLASCSSNPTADQSLKDDSQRKEIMISIVNRPSYMNEMMQQMMDNDSCKQMMMDNMMNDPSMKGMHMDKMMSMCKDDSSMCKMMMGKTMEMCDMDQSKCNMMMESMQSHPNVMKSMKGQCDMDNMKK